MWEGATAFVRCRESLQNLHYLVAKALLVYLLFKATEASRFCWFQKSDICGHLHIKESVNLSGQSKFLI